MATNQPAVIPPATNNSINKSATKPINNTSKKPETNDLTPVGEGALNSVSSNNTTPLGAANNFDKALNTEFKKEAGANKEPGPVVANNVSKLVSGINNRIKTSEQTLAANRPAEQPGLLDRVTTFAKNAASNIMPKTTNKPSENKPLPVEELGDDSGIGDDISIVADSENYVIILGVFLVIILIILIYFFSKTFNVSRTLDKMSMYQRYQKLSSLDMTQQEATEPLYKFQIASSYNACHSGNQMFSYTSELITKAALKSGARYIELNVFSSMYGPKGVPVVDSGFARGEWKLMLNTTTFESVIRVINENAFRVASSEDGVPNNTDPLFIGLNLSTGGNTYCLDLMADILTDYFRDKLLDAKYAFQFTADFAKTPLRELENKVVIFSSIGFEGSRLEELVNAVWYDEKFNTINSVAGAIESFSIRNTNNQKANNQANNSKSKSKKAINNFAGTSDKKADQLKKLEDSLTKETILDNSAKQSNKSSKTGGPSDAQINSEKSLLTQNIKSLADELKESGLDVQDVDEIVDQSSNGGATNSNFEDTTTSQSREVLGDVPSPTSLGLDQILDSAKVNHATIMRVCAQDFDSAGYDGGRIQAYTQAGGLCIVVPHREGDYITRNYDPQQPFELGCQFIAMNFQEIDENMDNYITRFESKAILPTNS